MFYEKYDQPIIAKFGVGKWKPLSAFSFRQLHRSLIEFHDYEIQQICCNLAGVESVRDELSFGYCFVDEQFGLQIHMLGTCNRDGRADWWVPVPENQFVMSYHEAKDKMVTLSDSCALAIKNCLPRCRSLMEQHETNPTIMLKMLDKFRNIEFPLDIQISILSEECELGEKVLFRPSEYIFGHIIRGELLEEPQSNVELHKGDIIDVKVIFDEHGHSVAVNYCLLPQWTPVDSESNDVYVGPEGGIIIEDEEYAKRGRITLEDCIHNCAITCEFCGRVIHTAFCGKGNAYATYDAMKKDLQLICDAYEPNSPELDLDEIIELIDRFADKY